MQEMHERNLKELLTIYLLSQVLHKAELLYAEEARHARTSKRMDTVISFKTGISALRQIIEKIESDTGCSSRLLPN